MDVWVVTVNGYVEAVTHTSERADEVMEDLKTHMRVGRGAGVWRKVGEDGWASDTVTSLHRQKWDVL